jgi:molecular chaperone HtpG
MDRCEEVLPAYLRFVKGVVDSADLPLNVSRELLQQNPHLATIRKNVVRNILSGLDGLRNTRYEQYLEFCKGLGPVLKEGLTRDWENREKVADLLLYESMNTEKGKFITLAEYVEKMPEGQDAIWFLTGESAEQLRNSPYLEAFRAKGFDVLLMTDAMDEFTIPQLGEYKGKKLKPADRGDVKASDEEIPTEVKDRFANLLAALKVKHPEVGDVRLTRRLTVSAACLVTEGSMSAHMERLFARAGDFAGTGAARHVLELNPESPVVEAVRQLHETSPDDARLDDYARLLYDQAVIAEGNRIADPVSFARRINDLLLNAARS